MLAIRKKNNIKLDKETSNIEVSNLTYELNPLLAKKAIKFSFNNSEGYFEIRGRFSKGYTYDFKMDVTPDLEYFTDGTIEMVIKLVSGANTSSTYYMNGNSKQISMKIVCDDENVFRIRLIGTAIWGVLDPVVGWVNKISFQNSQWSELDVEFAKIKLTESVKETNSLNKINSLVSNNFKIVLNEQNINALEFNPSILTNFNNTHYIYDFKFTISNRSFKGELYINSLTKQNLSYIADVNLYSSLPTIMNELKNLKVNSLRLTDPRFVTTNIKSKSYSTVTGTEEYCWILHDYGQNITENFFNNKKGVNNLKHIQDMHTLVHSEDYDLDTEVTQTNFNELFINNFYPAYFAKYLFKKIHSDLNLTVAGNFLNTEIFNKLLVLPNDVTKDINKHNNAFRLHMYNSPPQSNVISVGGSTEIGLHGVVDPDFNNGTIVCSPLCRQYSPHEALYTGFKYDITFLVENEDQLPGTNKFSIDLFWKYKSLAPGQNHFIQHYYGGINEELSGTTDVKLTGEVSEVYVPNNTSNDAGDIEFRCILSNYSTNDRLRFTVSEMLFENVEKISSKTAPKNYFNSAKILPKISQFDFIKNIINTFNLFPVLEDNKITYYTFDEYYQNRKEDIFNLDTYEDIDINYELPPKYLDNKYIYSWKQSEQGDQKYFNENNEYPFGSFVAAGSDKSIKETKFENIFSIPEQKEIEISAGNLINIGTSAKNKIQDDRKIYSGITESYYMHNFEPVTDDLTFGLWENKSIGGSIDYLTENFTLDSITNINSAVNTTGSISLLQEEIYNKYHKAYLDNLVDVNGLKIKVKVYLTTSEFARLHMNSLVKFKNSFFYLEKISNWSNNTKTTLTLIKINKLNPYHI